MTQLRRATNGQRMTFYESLTPRQSQIVRYVIEGLNNEQIAAALSIVSGAVANHLTVIYDKLERTGLCAENRQLKRVELVRFFGDFFEQYTK